MIDGTMAQLFDGFWLPKKLRQEFITPDTTWAIQYHRNGRPVAEDGPEVVAARWPCLLRHQWEHLMQALLDERDTVGSDFLPRLQEATATISRRFLDPTDPLSQAAASTLPNYTGYSKEMIAFAMGSLDLTPLDTLGHALPLRLPDTVRHQYVSLRELSSLDGRIRLYGTGRRGRARRLFPSFGSRADRPLPMKQAYPQMVLGYAAGNVIGASHLIALLAQVSALVNPIEGRGPRSGLLPAIVVKNSRLEPLFAPLLFAALEQIDASLVSTTAILIWDYEDASLQEYLVSRANLVIAAAADSTIDEIDDVIRRVQTPQQPIRFHRHGHKVSFTTVGLPYLQRGVTSPATSHPEIIHVVALLAAVDSIFWDQNGCLSSRVHFVEHGDETHYTAREYGQHLAERIRLLSAFLPRGATPLHGLRGRFDKYSALTGTGQVHLCSTYRDDFLVIVDERPWNPSTFRDVVNDCMERTVVVRPVNDIMEVPDLYLSWIPHQNLQTMMVAIDGADSQAWSPRFASYVDAVGERGVTGVRTVGRGAFPQLGYSWDGYLPLDLSAKRPPGHFTTVEFENTYQQIMDTYEIFMARGGGEWQTSYAH